MKRKFNMKKTLITLLTIITILLVGCGNTEENSNKEKTEETEETEKTEEAEEGTESVEMNNEVTSIKVCFPGGAPALSIAKLAAGQPSIDENFDIEYEFQSTPDLLATKVMSEEADIAIVPSNLAALAYNKEVPYKLAGTAVWGTLHLISTQDIDSFEDLKGKEIYSFGKDLTPDLVVKYLLTQNNIDPDKDVTFNYLSAASEVGPAFLSGKTDLAIFSEPVSTNVLLNDDKAEIIFDFNQEWSKLTNTEYGYPQASLIVKSELIENNEDFVRAFIEEFEKSQEWAKENPDQLGDYAEQLEIGMKKPMVLNGIDRMNIGPLTTEDGENSYGTYYNMLLEYAPDVIGGKLPDEGFYFRR